MIKNIFTLILIIIYLNTNAQIDSLNYYLADSDYEKAATFGEKLITENKASANDFIKTAQAYTANYEYRKALKTLNKANLLYPNNNDISFNEAKILYSYKRLNKANYKIKSVLEKDSLNKKYLLLAMKISNAKKAYTTSLTHNNKLLLLDSTNAVFNYMAGKTCVKLKKNKEAIIYFENAIAYDTSYGDAYKWLAKMHDAFRNWDTSLYYINRAINIEPDNINYYRQRANTNYDRTHYFRALPDFEKVWKADTNSSKISFKLGVCYLQIEKYKMANKFFIKSYNIDSTNYKINQYLGMSYYHLKEYDKAVHYIEQAQKIIQPDGNIVKVLQSHLAINYFMNKQYKKAIDYNKRMQKLKPENYYYSYFIAESYFALKDFRNAKKHYEKIPKKLPPEYQENMNKHLIIINEQLFFKGEKK